MTLHPVDNTPDESHSKIFGLDNLASLPIMNSFSSLVKDSDPRALPRLNTTSSLRSSKAIPRISFALNIF